MKYLKINKWEGFRISLIALALGGVAVVLGNEFLSGKKEQETAIKVTLPAQIPLSNWQFIKSNPIAAKNENKSDIGQLYQYRNGNDTLEIDTRYQFYTDGNASRLLMVYQRIPPATLIPQTKYKKDLGYYYLFDYQNKAYLSACMPPKGETTVTQQQYVNNRSRYGWSIPRAFGWLLGQQDLYDGRCLWTVFSMPVDLYFNPDAIDHAALKLETAWFEWYRWWQNQPFP
ncbi:cyanoexosortase A system-associated protein [Aphanothece hegewaldii CCALA 016]|uniref:Cyanoexosortase A system-associated protein n=1 Tax=Aphanothece hegewaldii CCALA 016 TaxID=2107694 RepID=A0A2T1LZY2_9CHRO|nr:cyanoexosortase A system-associated protein [Aphanothece hegewaldii]PSF37981.1 cyanoexosortase A system-associated protein [Aphanothece hegewaldii CCALA 016]